MPLLAVSIDCFCNIEVQRCKESDFLGSGQIASGELSARTHTHTDKCKISIMICRDACSSGGQTSLGLLPTIALSSFLRLVVFVVCISILDECRTCLG